MQNILILKFPHSSLFGGGERHTLLLVEALQKKDFKFFLATSCQVLLKEFSSRKWLVQRWWAGPEPVSKMGLLLWPFTLIPACLGMIYLLIYYRWFKKVRILYCLSLTEKILATLPARIIGLKVIWVEHVTFERWLTKNPLKYLYRYLASLVTIVAISRVIKQQLIDDIRIKQKGITVIYIGIDLTRFKMKEYRWQNSARYNVGCVARIEPEKGIEFLLQAVKLVKEFIPFMRLIIVGEGRERRRLEWLSERLDLKEIIQWVGYQKEVEKWYSYFDVYVLPSVKRESFGITLVEAMASGIPVIASRIGGTVEVIDHKKTGLLAEPGSSRDLADQLLYLFNNRGEIGAMAKRARAKVEKEFSLERMSRDFYLLLRK